MTEFDLPPEEYSCNLELALRDRPGTAARQSALGPSRVQAADPFHPTQRP
jgi:hypothetical protein